MWIMIENLIKIGPGWVSGGCKSHWMDCSQSNTFSNVLFILKKTFYNKNIYLKKCVIFHFCYSVLPTNSQDSSCLQIFISFISKGWGPQRVISFKCVHQFCANNSLNCGFQILKVHKFIYIDYPAPVNALYLFNIELGPSQFFARHFSWKMGQL